MIHKANYSWSCNNGFSKIQSDDDVRTDDDDDEEQGSSGGSSGSH